MVVVNERNGGCIKVKKNSQTRKEVVVFILKNRKIYVKLGKSRGKDFKIHLYPKEMVVENERNGS